MGIFDKLFGTKNKVSEDNKNLNNTKLIKLLEKFGENVNQENYFEAFNEIMQGNSILILPSVSDGKQEGDWTILEPGSELKMTSIFDEDGLKVLAVFTSPEKLVEWTKEETQYTAMKAKDLLDLCQVQGIDRIVIDTGMPTMFVIERNRENVQEETIEKEMQVTVGTPTNPISGELLEKFQANFSKVSVINEVYHYAMVRNDESILILGFELDIYSDDSRAACINSVQKSMEDNKLDLPLEIMFMSNDEDWIQTVKEIENSLIYKK